MTTLYYDKVHYNSVSNVQANNCIGLIDNQNDNFVIEGKLMKDITYGAMGNIASNGCGVIALYNILTSSGNEVNFIDIKRKLESSGGAFVAGLLGTTNIGLRRVLSTKFKKVVTISWQNNQEKWDQIAEESHAIIVRIRWNGTLAQHFFAGVPQFENGVKKFRFYNSGVVSSRRAYTVDELVVAINKRGMPLRIFVV